MNGRTTQKSESMDVTVQMKPIKRDLYTEQLICLSDIIPRLFGEEAELEQVSRIQSDREEFIACQTMDGDVSVFLGLTGEKEALLSIASKYARENFTTFDEDSYDALCEIINCINGTFATRLSEDDIHVNLYPPVYYLNPEITKKEGIYMLTLILHSQRVNILLSIDGTVEIH